MQSVDIESRITPSCELEKMQKPCKDTHMKNASQKERFIELRAQGKSFSAIADEIRVSKPTLIAWSRELAEQIQNLRSINDEALVQRYRLTKEREIQTLSSQLDAVEKELASRSLADIPSEKLYGVLFKLLEEARREQKPLMLKHTEDGIDITEDMVTQRSWTA